jgi:hypothetical protein
MRCLVFLYAETSPDESSEAPPGAPFAIYHYSTLDLSFQYPLQTKRSSLYLATPLADKSGLQGWV